MSIDDHRWLSIADTFAAAALTDGSWLDALSALAIATGSRAGELIGFGSVNSVPFNYVTDLGPDWVEDFIAAGGGDPEVNPIVRAGSGCSVLHVRSSAEFITPEERRSNPFMAEHAHHFDIPYICLTPLVKESGTLIGLAVLRSAGQGEISANERSIFASIAPHALAAVRTQIALEHQGALMMAGAMEALLLAVFICDRRGAVKAVTPAAEALLTGGDLRVRRGLLSGARLTESRILTDAIDMATGGLQRPGSPVASTILIHGKHGLPLVLEVVPVPSRQHAFSFEARALVVVRRSQPRPERLQLLLQKTYRLTDAEIDVACRLVTGVAPEAIALARGATVGTVRAQIRSIYDKLDVHRLSELIARLNQLS
jgi:DNA-binding CsgD family transcriptional regulator